MRLSQVVIIGLVLLLGVGLAACGSTTPPPDVEATVSAAVAATVAAQPAPAQESAPAAEPTPYPTYTAYPTYTPYPTLVMEAEAAEATEEPVEADAEPTEEPAAAPAEEAPPPTPTLAPAQPVETAVRPQDGAAMVFVPAGEFMMGAGDAELAIVGAGGPPKLAGGDEQPKHPVYVEGFWIDQTEVTNAQFSQFVNLTGYQTTAEARGFGLSGGEEIYGATFFHPRGVETGIDDKPNHPVVQVSWQDAQTYCEWAGGRLPTEAEWEKAARGAASDRLFPWGNAFQMPEFNVATVTNFCSASCAYEEGRDPNVDDGFAHTAPVGSFPAGASPYGALDMAGNVWEWVADYYVGYPGTTYEQAEDFGESYRVVRGGSWDNAAQHLRVTFRQNNEPHWRTDGTGFRCAVSEADFQPEEMAPAEEQPEEAMEAPAPEEGGEEAPAPEEGGEETPAPEEGGEETPVPEEGGEGEETPTPEEGGEETPTPEEGG